MNLKNNLIPIITFSVNLKQRKKKKFELTNYHLPRIQFDVDLKSKEKKNKFELINYHLPSIEFDVDLKREKK
jgi:hypothetical protein